MFDHKLFEKLLTGKIDKEDSHMVMIDSEHKVAPSEKIIEMVA